MGVATPRSSRRRFLRRQPQTSSESVGSRQDFLTAAGVLWSLQLSLHTFFEMRRWARNRFISISIATYNLQGLSTIEILFKRLRPY